MVLSAAQIAEVKGKGFLRNRGTECFSGRIVAAGTIFTADDLMAVAEIARRFGNGKTAFTARQAVEVFGIPYDRIDDAIAFAREHGLYFGGTGNKVRPVVACKGTTCVYGNFDTQGLAEKIHQKYYVGWSGVTLPHKFKIAVGGCPNSCMKPSLNDFGIEGHRIPKYDSQQCRGCKTCTVERSCPTGAARLEGGKLIIDDELCTGCGVCVGKCPFNAVEAESRVMYQIYVGGTWGKASRMGTPLSRLVGEDEIFPILEKTMLWFRENAFAKERLGKAIDRIGFDKMEKELFSNDILERKQSILEQEIKQR